MNGSQQGEKRKKKRFSFSFQKREHNNSQKKNVGKKKDFCDACNTRNKHAEISVGEMAWNPRQEGSTRSNCKTSGMKKIKRILKKKRYYTKGGNECE